MKAHFLMFAHYNAWANRRLYAAAGALADADRRRDAGAFFGSLHATLNHLLVTDVIWLARLRSIQGPPWGLDHIAHDDFADLTAAREALDDDLIAHVRDDADPAGTIAYRRVSAPEPVTQPVAEALAHLFNHQTHHRGQCHAILTRIAGEAPELDLLFHQREAAS